MNTILFLAALVMAAILLGAVLSIGNFMFTKAPTLPDWRLAEDERRALDAAFNAAHPKFTPIEGRTLRPGFTRDHHAVIHNRTIH